MTTLAKLNNEIKAALITRDKERAGLLRLLLSDANAIAKTDLRDTADVDVIRAAGKLAKKIAEARDAATTPDQIAKADAEAAIVAAFIPPKASEADLLQAIREAILASGKADLEGKARNSWRGIVSKALPARLGEGAFDPVAAQRVLDGIISGDTPLQA